ncbi:hypothetical protein I4U23_005154 [Adineta vaga]|nr:hypothetical protein I4U23_005154 [Adineta vaga]
MLDGPLQYYFLFGILQHGSKMPVDLKFRPQLNYRSIYHTIETRYDLANENRLIHQREIHSIENIVEINKTMIHITNLKVQLDPMNQTESNRLLKRPYFDRLIQQTLFGDFRSRDNPNGYKWMLFPTPESLMTPDLKFYEGQKWSVVMAGGAFEINYELTYINHVQNQATIQGRNGFCLNGLIGNKRWNVTWIIDIHTGLIRQMNLDIDQQMDNYKENVRIKIIKEWIRGEEDPEKVIDYDYHYDF